MTTRDDVWFRVLTVQLPSLEPFKRLDLGFKESKRHTVQRVLQEMEEKRLIRRKTEGGAIYYPDIVAKGIFDPDSLTQRERNELDELLAGVEELTDGGGTLPDMDAKEIYDYLGKGGTD